MPVPDAAVVGILDDIVLPLLTGVRATASAVRRRSPRHGRACIPYLTYR
jgi:hypothetical protein